VSDRVRIGDRERANAAERLSAHHAAGRLSLDELETRIERATAAVYADELRALEADLPSSRAVVPWRPPRVAPLVAAGVALAVVATVAIGHPVFPPVLLALLLWCAAARRHPTRRSHA